MKLDRLFLRLRYLWAFYKSTLWVTIPFGLVTGCIVFREKGIEEAVKVFLYFYTIWGLLLDAIGKLVFKKSVFFFYIMLRGPFLSFMQRRLTFPPRFV